MSLESKYSGAETVLMASMASLQGVEGIGGNPTRMRPAMAETSWAPISTMVPAGRARFGSCHQVHGSRSAGTTWMLIPAMERARAKLDPLVERVNTRRSGPAGARKIPGVTQQRREYQVPSG